MTKIVAYILSVVSLLGLSASSGQMMLGGTISGATHWSISGSILTPRNASATLKIPAYNCSGNTNGGKLTASADGSILCSDDISGAGGGSTVTYPGIEIANGGALGTHYGSVSFDAGQFDVAFGSPTASGSVIRLDWTNGPASRSASQTITGAWTFNINPSFSGGYALSTTASQADWNTIKHTALTAVTASAPLSGSGTIASPLIFTNPGYITGNQTITLSGGVSGSGTTAITTTVASESFWDTAYTKRLDSASGTAPLVLTLSNNALTGSITSGNLTATAPLQFDQTRQVLGGSAALSVASGYDIALTASHTAWEAFRDTPSTRITAGTNLSWSGNTLNATTSRPSSNSLDFDELVNAMTLDANTSIASAGFFFTTGSRFGIASSSPMAMLSVVATRSWQNSGGHGVIKVRNDVSARREAIVMERAANTGGLSFILDNRGTSGRKYEFFSTDDGNAEGSGKFLIFDSTGANYPLTIASNSAIGIYDTTPTTTLDVNGNASVSGWFEALKFIGGASSHSFSGTIVGPSAGVLSVGTIANKLKNLVADVVRAITTFVFPISTNPTVAESGSAAMNTASKSFEYHDGTNQRGIGPCDRRPTYVLKGTDLTAKNQWPILIADDPLRIKFVQVTASGSNSLSWNLRTGSATVPATNVFTADHQASGATVFKYTTFGGTASVSDGDKLDVVVTSTSATLDSVIISACLQYDTTE